MAETALKLSYYRFVRFPCVKYRIVGLYGPFAAPVLPSSQTTFQKASAYYVHNLLYKKKTGKNHALMYVSKKYPLKAKKAIAYRREMNF